MIEACSGTKFFKITQVTYHPEQLSFINVLIPCDTTM